MNSSDIRGTTAGPSNLSRVIVGGSSWSRGYRQ